VRRFSLITLLVASTILLAAFSAALLGYTISLHAKIAEQEQRILTLQQERDAADENANDLRMVNTLLETALDRKVTKAIDPKDLP
jgi:Tfp pilus assembly protein PilN